MCVIIRIQSSQQIKVKGELQDNFLLLGRQSSHEVPLLWAAKSRRLPQALLNHSLRNHLDKNWGKATTPCVQVPAFPGKSFSYQMCEILPLQPCKPLLA